MVSIARLDPINQSRMPASRTPPRRSGGVVPFTALRADADRPLFEQIYSALREHIVRRRLAPGSRLAASRALAAELGVSRFTIVAALDQLRAEGYLVAAPRGGTFVAETLPDVTM